jgi:hypothetical protein
MQSVAESLCGRPGETEARRASRTRDLVHNTMGFRPRDGLEYMLSTLMVGHFEMIVDSMHDVFQGQADAMKARTKSTIVAMDRSMLTLLRELRSSRQRPLATWAEDAQHEAEAWPAASAGAPPGEVHSENVGPAEPARAEPGLKEPRPAESGLAEPAAPLAENTAASFMKSGPVPPAPEQANDVPDKAEPPNPDPERPAQGRITDSTAGDMATEAPYRIAPAGAATRNAPQALCPPEAGQGTATESLAAFLSAFAAVTQTLEEAQTQAAARGLDSVESESANAA